MQAKAHSKTLFFVTIVALIFGGVVGSVFGVKADPLGEFAKWIVQALKGLAVPLLFFAIVDALAKSHVSGSGFRSLIVIAGINAICAATIALILVNFLQPGNALALLKDTVGQAGVPTTKLDWNGVAASFIPESVVQPFATGSTPGVIVLALAVGLALHGLQKRGDSGAGTAVGLVETGLHVLIAMIGWLVYLVPLAVFGSVAKAVGKSGLALAGGLGLFVVVCIGGMALHILTTYQAWILLHPKITLQKFWRAARNPATYAFGINSSLATMPLTLTALNELEVKDEASRLSVCVGTNFNNDGILLYEVVAALVLAQAFGIDLSLPQQLYVVLVSVVATFGVAGFPEAGIVALSLVLSAVGLPNEVIALLLSVDWVIARTRSTTNVLGDMAVGIAIDRKLKECASLGHQVSPS
jgi:DAACS family dicarboxylate/amino acid:cation (Na+ or H+) symporter